MAGDILDFLSNNWGTILGINPAQAEAAATNGPALGGGPYGGAPTPPPNSLGFQGGGVQTQIAPPPASVMNSAGPSFSPSGAVDQPVFTDPMSGAPMPGPVSGAPYNVGYGGGPQPPTPPPSGPGTAAAAVNPNAPVPGFAPPPGQGYPGGAIPTSTGPVMPGGQGYGGGSPSALGQTAGGLSQALGLPARYEGGVATPANPNIGGQFGLQRPPFLQTQAGQDMITRGLAGLGRGLSTIGGNTGLGAFARGAGGSLTGGVNELNAQQGQLRAAQNDFYAHGSTALRDMLAADAAQNTSFVNKARANLYNSRAAQYAAGVGSGTGAYQNDPYWKTMNIEKMASQLQIKQMWQLNQEARQFNWDEDRVAKEKAQINTDISQYKNNLFAEAGIDPDRAEKLKTMGIEPPQKDGKPNPNFNPFDSRKMSMDQWNAKVLKDHWYLDQNGEPKQRTIGPGEEYTDSKTGERKRLPPLPGTTAPAAAMSPREEYALAQPPEQPAP